MTIKGALGGVGVRTQLQGRDGSCSDKLMVPEWTVTPTFPGLPWLLKGQEATGPSSVAYTGWRQGWSCEPIPLPPHPCTRPLSPKPVATCIYRPPLLAHAEPRVLLGQGRGGPGHCPPGASWAEGPLQSPMEAPQ